LAIGTGVGLSIKPWRVYREQRKIADESIKEMREAEGKKATLTRERAKYESALGREELARKQGYRRPDERPIGD
jgi:hypothetical protein